MRSGRIAAICAQRGVHLLVCDYPVELDWIEDADLRESTAKTWETALSRSPLEPGDLREIPFTLLVPDLDVAWGALMTGAGNEDEIGRVGQALEAVDILHLVHDARRQADICAVRQVGQSSSREGRSVKPAAYSRHSNPPAHCR